MCGSVTSSVTKPDDHERVERVERVERGPEALGRPRRDAGSDEVVVVRPDASRQRERASDAGTVIGAAGNGLGSRCPLSTTLTRAAFATDRSLSLFVAAGGTAS